MRSVQVLGGFFLFLLRLILEELALKVPLVRRVFGLKSTGPKRFRDLLERFGGAFIKFGQFLSMRSDILPPAYCKELATLFDRVPPFPTDQAKRIIEKELGKPIPELFSSFDDEPVGAASFGQVYLATLKGGDDDGQRAAI